MPLIKREVEPILVSRVDIDKSIKDELECVSNYTLASIIRQLGNLGKHAEDIFGDLFQEASGLAQRATNIQNRMEKINNYLSNLDPMKDSVSMRDINSRISFTSSRKMEKEVVSSPTMPSAMKDTYNRCQQTPPLSKLSKYREDGKDALKFYTDPKFFFTQWLNEQQKDIDKKKKKRKKRPQSKLAEGKPKKVITRKEKYKDAAKGKELMEIDKERERAAAEEQKKTSNDIGQKSEPMDTSPSTKVNNRMSTGALHRRAPAPPEPNNSTLPPPPPPPLIPNGSGAKPSDNLPPPPPPDMMDNDYASVPNVDRRSAAIPPPPPPPPPGPGVPAAPPPPAAPPAPAPPPLVASSGGPAPPPPPPVPNGTGSGARPAPAVPSMADAKAALKSAANRTSNAPAIVDARDDLLSAIRSGMQLRKVDTTVKQQQHEPQDNSVEAILRRRIALELSDDEEGESMYDSDEDEWSD